MSLTHVYPPVIGFFSVTDFGGSWGPMLASLAPRARNNWLWNEVSLALLSFLFLLAAIGIAASHLRRVWQEEPPSARLLWLRDALCRPIIGASLLRAWMRHKLARNPIGWLEQRSWTGRLVTWGWLAAVITVYLTALGANYSLRVIFALQNLLAGLLLLGIAASASASFHRERESGVMELLLVSPMTEAQIIGGRLRGLWGQFFPALVLIIAVWFYLDSVAPWETNRNSFSSRQFYCVSFLILPVVGLYFSLRCRHFLSAFLCTLFTGLALPLIVRALLLRGRPDSYARSLTAPGDPTPWLALSAFVILLQLAIAACLALLLFRNLRNRSFAFSRTGA